MSPHDTTEKSFMAKADLAALLALSSALCVAVGDVLQQRATHRIVDRSVGHLELFGVLGCPVLVGLSRKSMVYKFLKLTPEEALNGTTALHALALQNGAGILRVHDVKEAIQTIRLWSQCQNAGKYSEKL